MSHRLLAPEVRPDDKRIRLLEVPCANDPDTPRAALLIPDAMNRRPALRFFASVTAAIAAKRMLEGGR